MPPITGMDPVELKERLDKGDADMVVLDVREDFEVATASIPGALHVPLVALPARLDELPRDREIVCVCHHGMRSLHAAQYLAKAGFARLRNLTGGIDAYAARADPSVPRY